MCVYDFHVGHHHLRPLVAFVGAHGATDLATKHWPPVYAVCCLTPLPSKVVTGLFVAASLVHFAEDGGPDGSIAVHSLAGLAWLWLGAQRALELMVAYLSFVHTPAHYARCWRRRRWAALVAGCGGHGCGQRAGEALAHRMCKPRRPAPRDCARGV